MRLAHDFNPYPHGDYLGRPNAHCRVRVYRPDDGESFAPVVVVTELPDNTGLSVTNACEMIAAKLMITVLQDRVLADVPFVYVEEWAPNDGVRNYSTFDIVGFKSWRPHPRANGQMTLDGPKWLPLSHTELLQLLRGAPFEEYPRLNHPRPQAERRTFEERERAILGNLDEVLTWLGRHSLDQASVLVRSRRETN